MAPQRIFFLNSGNQLHAALTLAFGAEKSHFVLYDDPPLVHFCDRFFANSPRLVVPGLWGRPPQTGDPQAWQALVEGIPAAKKTARELREFLPAAAEVYYFAATGLLDVPLFIQSLLERNPDQPVRWVRGWDQQHPQGFYRYVWGDEEPEAGEDEARRQGLADLSQAMGLAMAQVTTYLPLPPWPGCFHWSGLGPAQPLGEEFPLEMAPWSELRRLLGLPRPRMVERAMLFVDTPLWLMPGVDFAKTQHNLARFFRGHLAAGKELYIKPHYRLKGQTSLVDTFAGNLAYQLPTVLPAELFLDSFPESYFINSSTLGCPTLSQKNCLLDYVFFEDAAHRRRISELVEVVVGEERDRVRFLRPEPKAADGG